MSSAMVFWLPSVFVHAGVQTTVSEKYVLRGATMRGFAATGPTSNAAPVAVMLEAKE